MAKLTDNTKIDRVNEAFGTVAQAYVREGANKKAVAMINALETLSPHSKLILFDILTKDQQ